MSYGEIDTLNMLFEKLDNLLNDSQGYYESFLDSNTLYKSGKMQDREFFGKMGDYLVACSALEFLAVKSMFELKKTIDKGVSPNGASVPQGGMPPSMAGMQPGMPGMSPNMGGRLGTPGNPVGGAPPSIVSASQAFTSPGTLPTPDPTLTSASQSPSCASCGSQLRANAKFCTRCGAKT